MSGQQIGTVVGYFVGGYFGNAQLGAIAGGYLGGVISPTVIKGPSIGDAQTQSSMAGMPIPKVFGHSPPIAPTLIDGDKVARKVTRETGGKGSTTVAENEGFIATRFFLVAESDGNTHIARITRNGKLVYSTVAGDELDPQSSAFAGQMTIWNGGPGQGPSPALEAIHGVGNTPYYRKRLCFEVRDDDETQTGGAANQYRVEVIGAGTANVECADVPWVHGNTGTEQRNLAVWIEGLIALAGGDNNSLRRSTTGGRYWDGVDYMTSTGWVLNDIYSVWAVHEAINSGLTWYISNSDRIGVSYNDGGFFSDFMAARYPMTGNVFEVNGEFWTGAHGTTNTTIFQPTAPDGSTDIDLGADYGKAIAIGSIGGVMVIGTDDGKIVTSDGTLRYTHPTGVAVKEFAYHDGIGYAVFNSGNYRYTEDSGTTWTSSGEVAEGLVSARGALYRLTFTHIYQGTRGNWVEVDDYFSDSDNGSRFATDGFSVLAVQNLGGKTSVLPSGYVLPDTADWYIDDMGNIVGGCSTRIDADAAVWKDIALDIAGRCHPLLPPQMAVDEMTDLVPGLVLGNATLTGADYMRTLCRWYTVDLPEYDDEIHSARRGRAIAATFDEDDLLTIEEEDDDTRDQAIRGFKRLTVMYPDPANNYVPTPQVAPRTSPDVTANNDVTMECPIPFDADTMRQKADIMQKIAFLDLEGKLKRNFRAQYSQYIASDAIMFKDRRYLITKASNDDSMVRFECTYDRPSAYTSLAIGSNAPPPTPQTSNLKGPTVFGAFNFPSLRSSDNVPGMYLAATGLLQFPGWPGADIYLSFDGGANFVFVRTMGNAARMGYLIANTDADGNDSSGLISVRLEGPGSLVSVSDEQIDAGDNRFAIISAGVADIGQFQTATPDSNGDYDLTNVERGQLGTIAAAHSLNDRFVMTQDTEFLAIDERYAGQVLVFRAVTRGTPIERNPTFSVVFDPPTFIIDGGEIT